MNACAVVTLLALPPCMAGAATSASAADVEPAYFISTEKTHNKFSKTIPPVLRVPSGAVVQVETKEATDGQLNPKSQSDDIARVRFEPIHPLTGPVTCPNKRSG